MKQICLKKTKACTSVTSFADKAIIAPIFFLLLFSNNGFSQGSKDSVLLNDSHFHLTNYVQEGTDIHKFLEIMGNKVGRVALFGIPLQQMWNYNNSGNFAPTYYLASDDPLYYYSFKANLFHGINFFEQNLFSFSFITNEMILNN